jgi:hypothetical protein
MFRRTYAELWTISMSIFLSLTLIVEFKSYGQPVVGDSVISISLSQAIDLGVKNSYKLRSSTLGVEVGEENIKQKKTDRLPDINLGLNGYLINDPTLFNEKMFGDPEKVDYTPYR